MQPMALFDLDHTLLDDDSENIWTELLRQKGWITPADQQQFDTFYQEYLQGVLNMHRYYGFIFALLNRIPLETLRAMQSECVERIMAHNVRGVMLDKVRWHEAQGHVVAIVSATFDFITRPVATALGFEHALCTLAKMDGPRFAGQIDGIPCLGAGKITVVEAWMQGKPYTWQGSWFYSDSRNDIPLLERVDHAVAVTPDDTLRQHALDRGWVVLDCGD